MDNGFLNLDSMDVFDEQWHHFTWQWNSSNGQVLVYKDGTLVYNGLNNNQHPAVNKSITPGGVFTMGGA